MIRRELDELMLDETCSTAAIEHLRECVVCREFHEKQTKLRQIVGGLGTVAAPADFDFRLRARLANESSSAASQFNFVEWPFVRRGLVAAALLLTFAIGAVLVRNVLNQPAAVDQTAKQTSVPLTNGTPKPQETVTPQTPESARQDNVTAVATHKRPLGDRTGSPTQAVIRSTPRLATVDSSSVRAEVIRGVEPGGSSATFPIDASLQSFVVSVDDGRGNARTISVPTISFGSHRLMQNANQFAPKRVW